MTSFGYVLRGLRIALLVVGFILLWLLYLFVLGPIFGYRIGEDAL